MVEADERLPRQFEVRQAARGLVDEYGTRHRQRSESPDHGEQPSLRKYACGAIVPRGCMSEPDDELVVDRERPVVEAPAELHNLSDLIAGHAGRNDPPCLRLAAHRRRVVLVHEHCR